MDEPEAEVEWFYGDKPLTPDVKGYGSHALYMYTGSTQHLLTLGHNYLLHVFYVTMDLTWLTKGVPEKFLKHPFIDWKLGIDCIINITALISQLGNFL